MVFGRVAAGLCALLLVTASASPLAQAQVTPTVNFSVSGNLVSIGWSAVPGAIGYEVQAALASTGAVLVQTVIPVTQLGPLTVPNGVYGARVRAIAGLVQGPWSEPVTITVGGVAAPPAPPTSFAALVNGNSVLLSWTLASTAGLSGLVVEQLTGPGGAVLQQIPVRVSTSSAISVPNGSYVLRLRSIGAGVSEPSNEIALTVPSCNAAAAIPVSASAVYGFATVSWPQVPGALGYTISVSQNGVPVLTAPFDPATTTASGPAGPGDYSLTLTANIGACGFTSGTTAFVSSSAPPPGPRAVTGLGIGAATGLVSQATNALGSDPSLRRSCGDNTWLFRVLQRLRAIDNRFGLNWKRGVVNDMSQDVLTYNFSEVPDFQATAPHIYAWDVISGHCGPNPVPNAANITDGRGQAGWTILPFLRAGYQP